MMKELYCTFLVLSSFGTVVAAPANPKPYVSETKSQGKITIKKFGDEWFQWEQADDGAVIVFDAKSGTYQFASVKTDSKEKRTLEASGVVWKAGVTPPERISAETLNEIWKSYIPNQSSGEDQGGQ